MKIPPFNFRLRHMAKLETVKQHPMTLLFDINYGWLPHAHSRTSIGLLLLLLCL